MIKDKPPDHRQILRRRAIVAVLALLVVGAGYGAYRWIATMSSGPSKHVMEVVTLKLIQPPPPPPPPPPPVPPPPPEAKMIEQPKETPDKPKAAEAPQPLALDAKGGPGSDSFGLGGRPGGAPLIGGGVGGGAGSKFGWYANLIQSEIQQVLQKDEKLGSSRYGITVAVWLSPSGRPERVKLLNTTGNHDIDQRIEQTLSAMPTLPQAPPQDMPQPVNLRIDSRAG